MVMKLKKPQLIHPLLNKEKNIDQQWTLYSFKGTFGLSHADIVYIKLLAKSAVDLKYCLLFVGVFASKIYTDPMKSRCPLKRKHDIFIML